MTSSYVVRPLAAEPVAREFTLVRLYALRAGYLLLAVGLGIVIWPSVIHHTSDLAIRAGAQLSLLAGLGAMATLGLRHPVKMLPLLVFEVVWKTIYLTAFALPLWLSHQINEKAASDITACLMVLIILPLIPWGFVFAEYVRRRGDRWS